MKLVEQIENLIDEYLAQVPLGGTEWCVSYHNIAESVLKGDELGFDEFEPFLKWLKRR